ncbi:MAG: RIP metalloprotease RseP [Myxococcota bacterium]|nr:RIP metalloprotease RseP [Myxococcota bacterium]
MTSILAFIVLIGVLITVHEFGHFIVAKLCGVKVEMFSVGFGKPIVRFVRGETEYRIAWLPFGGYVKLLGQVPGEAEPCAEDQGRSLQDKGPFQRILIYAAGPAMNLVLPFAIIIPFVALADRYTRVESSQVGALDQSMPAWTAGLREGDTIKAIDGQPVDTFWEVKQAVEGYRPSSGPLAITIRRDQASADQVFQVRPKPVQSSHPLLGFSSTDYLIGYQPAFLDATIAIQNQTGVLARAGLQTFDRIEAINGRKTPRLVDVRRALTGLLAGQALTIDVSREGMPLNLNWPFLRLRKNLSLSTTVPADGVDFDGEIRHAGTCLTSVAPDASAGALFKRGDCLLAVEGERQSLGAFLIRRLKHNPEEAKTVTWLREGQEMTGRYRLKAHIINDPMAGEVRIWRLGFSLPQQSLIPGAKVPSEHRLAHGWYEARTQVPREIEVTLRTIGGMVTGQVSPTQLSGPLTIFHLAGTHARAGLDQFLRLMVLLSLSIGLFNLLPIPLLDGGHILVAGVELITRRPLPEKMQAGLQYVGLFLILALLLFALGNDAVRTWRLTNG